jgi:hypothetical protein
VGDLVQTPVLATIQDLPGEKGSLVDVFPLVNPSFNMRFFLKKLFILLLLYWGYIVTFTKMLTMYHK